MHATQTDQNQATRRRANTGMGGNGLEGVDVMREEFQDVSTSQRALERSMTSLSVDLSRKIEEMKRLMTGNAKQPADEERKSRRMSHLISKNAAAKNLLKAAVNKQILRQGSSLACDQSRPNRSPSPMRPSELLNNSELDMSSTSPVTLMRSSTSKDDDDVDDRGSTSD